MFYVKEDDMDDLLRRAAENYEVDAQEAYDWEGVEATILKAAPVPAVVQPKRKRRFAFWWLLLIPVGWFAGNEWNKFHSSQKTIPAIQQPSNIEKEKSSVPYENSQKQEESAVGKDRFGDEGVLKPSDQNVNKVGGNKVAGNQVAGNSNVRGVASDASVQTNKKPVVFAENEAVQPDAIPLKEQPGKTGVEDVNNEKLLPRQNPPFTDLLADKDSKKPEPVKQATTTSGLKKTEKNNTHYFYAGLLAGPDISFVKFQQADALGINAGLIAGYRFNRLSVETGLIYAKKNYYTKGEYFDKSKIPYFNNAEILSVDGYCQMLEIPLNVRYNFGEKKKHAWFASAGFSSYLMGKEYYNYEYVRYDTVHQGGYPYYNASKNWFSILNVSAGYELKTGDKTNLRIEPYYKIPVTGVGMGNISLSSLGVNVGITRRIP